MMKKMDKLELAILSDVTVFATVASQILNSLIFFRLCHCHFASLFIFSMPSKVIIIVIEFIFLGINIFWALLGAHCNPRLTARAKMSLSRAQNIFMPANMNSIVLFLLAREAFNDANGKSKARWDVHGQI